MFYFQKFKVFLKKKQNKTKQNKTKQNKKIGYEIIMIALLYLFFVFISFYNFVGILFFFISFILFFIQQKDKMEINNIDANHNDNPNPSEFQPNKEWQQSITNNNLEEIRKLFDSMDKQNQEVIFFHSLFKFNSFLISLLFQIINIVGIN